MTEIFILAEHREGEIRDVTFEMLSKGRETAEKTGSDVVSVLLGFNTQPHAKTLSKHADKVVVVDDEKLENFNSETYLHVLSTLIKERKPVLMLVGQTSFGAELAPRLATRLNIPLATDCLDFTLDGETLTVTRQMYGGKVNVKASLQKSGCYIVGVRQATFEAGEGNLNGEIAEFKTDVPEAETKRFLEYVQPPIGGVDITAAEVLIGIGRGIQDAANVPVAEELAASLGGVLACSRPVVDKGWLPNDRQVGTSGKTVKPKLYVAVGISGAFQHVLGMKSSDLVIAINKDAKAPIFNVADYGVVEDLLKIVPQLTTRIKELKAK